MESLVKRSIVEITGSFHGLNRTMFEIEIQERFLTIIWRDNAWSCELLTKIRVVFFDSVVPLCVMRRPLPSTR